MGRDHDTALSLNPEISSVERRDISKSGDIMGQGRDITEPVISPKRALGQVHVFENLIENLPARAARKNFQRFACLRAVSEKIYECVRSAHT